MKALHISFDASISQPDNQGIFYTMMGGFSKYWERIDIITPHIKGGQERVIHNNVFIHPSPWKFYFQSLFIIFKGNLLIIRHQHNVIILHSGPPFIMDIGAFVLSAIHKCPIILEIMHIVGYPRAGNFYEKIGMLLTKFWIKFIHPYALAIRVINSKDTYPLLLEWGIPKEKIEIIPAFYIDYEVFKPSSTPRENNSILFVGRLVENKGIFEFLKAISLAKQQIPSIKATIIGNGPLEKKMHQLIDDYSLDKNIIHIPWLKTQSDLAKYYTQTQVLVMTSYNEGGPRVTLEAMACGTPVITTRVGIMNEILEDRKNGLFIDWNPKNIANMIISLLKDQKLRESLGKNGSQSVTGFEYASMIKNYATTYHKLLNT